MKIFNVYSGNRTFIDSTIEKRNEAATSSPAGSTPGEPKPSMKASRQSLAATSDESVAGSTADVNPDETLEQGDLYQNVFSPGKGAAAEFWSEDQGTARPKELWRID